MSESLGIIENEKHREDFIFYHERMFYYAGKLYIFMSSVEVIVAGKIRLNVRSFLA